MSAPSNSQTSPIPPKERPTKIFEGGCHCGKFTFELRHPTLEDGFEVVSCNCSICTQRGYLVIYTFDPDKDFKLTKGTSAELSEYRFGPRDIAHKFCPACGCGIFEEAHKGTWNMVGVNVRTIRGLDLDSLTLRKQNGRGDEFGSS